MLDEQKAFIESIRADERAKLVKRDTQIAKHLHVVFDLLHVGDLVDEPKPKARKPRTVKLDEGLVALIYRCISSELDYTKEEIGRSSGVAGRQLGNYLVALEKQNKIVKTGKGKAAIYTLAPIEDESVAAS